jgi:hypothetical protein
MISSVDAYSHSFSFIGPGHDLLPAAMVARYFLDAMLPYTNPY